MRHIKEILRLKLEAKLSHRKISASLNIGLGTVSTYSKRAIEAGLTWPLPGNISESDLKLNPLFHTPPNLNSEVAYDQKKTLPFLRQCI